MDNDKQQDNEKLNTETTNNNNLNDQNDPGAIFNPKPIKDIKNPAMPSKTSETFPNPVLPEEKTPVMAGAQPAKNKRKWLIPVVVVIIAIVVAFGLGTYLYSNKLNNDVATQRLAATYVDHITVAYNTEPTGYYPEAIPETTTINYLIYYYEGLTSFNKDMEIQPQLAVSWENPDTNTWRFHLRNNVTFHNGQAMTADDVVASFNMAIDNDNLNVYIPTVTSIEKIDDYTVDIKTDSATPILANLVPGIYILPASLIESQDWSNPVGTGPYKLVSVEGSNHNLTRFDDYYGTQPKVKDVTLTSIASDEERLAALKSGQVDVSIEYTPTPEGTKTDDGKPILFAVSQPIDAIFLFFDSVRDQSPYITGATTNPLKDVRVREAMALALNIPAIINSGDYANNSQQATQLVPPSIFGYNPDIQPLEQNVEQARVLMQEAGYPNGFTITFDTAGQQVNFQNLLKEQLADINITLNVNYSDPSGDTYFTKLFSGDISMVCLSWTAPSGDALEAYENILGLGGMANLFQVDDSQINDLIDQVRNATDLSKRKEYLQTLATVVDQEKYIIPLLSQTVTYDYRDGLALTSRADGMNLAAETSGAIPDNLKDYTYLDTIKKIFHL